MIEEACYKEDSLQDFATWAAYCGHYSVAPLIQNYTEYLCYVRNGNSEPITPDTGRPSTNS